MSNTIKVTVLINDTQELVQEHTDIEDVPSIDDFSDGISDIVGEQPTREERRS